MIRRFLLKLLDHITSIINQLPDPKTRKELKQSPYMKEFDIPKTHHRPDKIKNSKMDRHRKGSKHSDETIFNHPRK